MVGWRSMTKRKERGAAMSTAIDWLFLQTTPTASIRLLYLALLPGFLLDAVDLIALDLCSGTPITDGSTPAALIVSTVVVN